MVLNAFKSRMLLSPPIEGTSLKIWALKQMLQRLPIALAQVKGSNTSENLLKEIPQITYSSYRINLLEKYTTI